MILAILLLTWVCQVAESRDVMFPESWTLPQARGRYEERSAQLRREQLQLLKELSVIFEMQAQAELASEAERMLATKIVKHWRSATHADKALEHAVQMAIKLPPKQQRAVEELASRMQPKLDEYRALQSAYREYLAARLADDWFSLTMTEKRMRVSEWLPVGDKQSIWLLARRPFSAFLPPDATSRLHFEQYASEKQSSLASGYRSLEKQIVAIMADARQLSLSKANALQQAAAARLVHVFESAYGQDARGLMLLEVDESLPVELRTKVQRLYDDVTMLVTELEAANQQQLQTLDSNLKAERHELCQAHRFIELIQIDTRREEVARLWRPMRIYARRSTKAGQFEDAYLYLRRGDKYEVDFLIDDQRALLERTDLWIFPEEVKLRPRMRRDVPAVGPGERVTGATPLGQEVFCHGPRGWQPAHVIDESPLGVELVWQSSADPLPIVEPRSALRVVP